MDMGDVQTDVQNPATACAFAVIAIIHLDDSSV
jgi:hypothetical protein